MPNIPTSDDSNVPLEVEELPPLRHAEHIQPLAAPTPPPAAGAGAGAGAAPAAAAPPAPAQQEFRAVADIPRFPDEKLPHPPPGPRRGPQSPASPVTLQRTQIDPTTDQALW